MSDPAVPEKMGMHPFLDAGPTGNLLELQVDLSMFKRLVLVRDEYQVLALRFVRVILPPCSEKRHRANKPNVSRFLCFLVGVDHHTERIKLDLLPFDGSHFDDPKCALVHDRDERPVPGVHAGIDHGQDFLLGEQVFGSRAHGVSSRGLDHLDLIPRDRGKLIRDQPVVEPLQERDVVPERVLLDGPAPVKGRFPLGDSLVDGIGCVLFERPDEPPPVHENRHDLEGPGVLDVGDHPPFVDVSGDQGPVIRGDPLLLNCEIEAILYRIRL